MGLTISPLHLRRAIQLDAVPDAVWEHFTDQASLAAWFGTGHRVEAYVPGRGGHLHLSVEIDGEREGFGGPVLVWAPGRELSVEDNWFGHRAWAVPTFLTLRLTPQYGGTLVELFHHGFERLGAAGAAECAAYEQGWDLRHLVALRSLVTPR